MNRPRLLDLFAGAGGAAQGYAEAGFEVVGIDHRPQPNYPFEFIEADALQVLHYLIGEEGIGARAWLLEDFAAIHASPPCQAYSPLNAYNRKSYAELVAPTRILLERAGLPYIVENVIQAPLKEPIILCGAIFGLRVYRHRGFETSFPVLAPSHPIHQAKCVRNGYLPTEEAPFMSIHGGRHSKAWREEAAEVMGVPWMRTIAEVCEAIPPAYTKYVGEFLMTHLNHHEPSPLEAR